MHDDQSAVFSALTKATSEGESVVLATVIATQGSIPRHAGSKMLIYSDGAIVGTIGGGAMEAQVIQEALAVFKDHEPRLRSYTLNSLEDGDPGICGGTAQIFIEPVNIAPKLLVIGAGHVGKALAELGLWMGYQVILCDDRTDLCNPEVVPGLAGYVVCKPSEVTAHVHIDNLTYVACVTRGLPVDLALFPPLLKTSAAYIGLIGSVRRWTITAKALQDQYQVSDSDLSRIHAPIGLELGSETPKEIALSILAEITMLRRGGTAVPLSADRSQLFAERDTLGLNEI
jgi:xanthine dehydrogenase accessory factor